MSAVIPKMKGNAASKVSGYFISENKRVPLSKRGSRKKRLCLTCTEVLQKSEARNQSDLNDLDHVHRAILAKSMLLVLMVKLNKISSTSEGNKGRMTHWTVRWLVFVTRGKNICFYSKMPCYRGHLKKLVIGQGTTGALRDSTTGQQLHSYLQRWQITVSVLQDQTNIVIISVRTVYMLPSEISIPDI